MSYITILDRQISVIEVYSIQGALVARKENDGSKIELQHSELSKGVYIIRFFGDNHPKSQKLIVN